MDEHTSDQQLVSRIAEGDDRAFAELVRAHARPLRGFIRRLGLGDDDEDVLQRVFLAAYRGARTYEGRASLRSWLFTIARREAWRARAKNARQAEREVPLLELGLEAGWGSDPERIATAAQDRARVTRALAALPQRDREILVLRDIEGLSGPETCEVLELSLTAMKSRLHRARLRFAAVLKDLDPETNTGAAGAEK